MRDYLICSSCMIVKYSIRLVATFYLSIFISPNKQTFLIQK